MEFYLILQPTRVTLNIAIDNIFSNNLQDDITSNVLLSLSDHFPQRISVKREQVDLKIIVSERLL